MNRFLRAGYGRRIVPPVFYLTRRRGGKSGRVVPRRDRVAAVGCRAGGACPHAPHGNGATKLFFSLTQSGRGAPRRDRLSDVVRGAHPRIVQLGENGTKK